MPLSLTFTTPLPLGDTNFQATIITNFKEFIPIQTNINAFIDTIDLSAIEAIEDHTPNIKKISDNLDKINHINNTMSSIEILANGYNNG